VLASFVNRVPIRAVMEAEPGLSNARNRAVLEATGDYILWTDDDVLVDERWLSAYCEAFERWPDAAIFGGNIKPWFEGTPPEWLEHVWPQVASAYASRDLGEKSVPLSREILPFGANFAVRTNDQRRYPYDPDLGVRPDSVIGGEETSVIKNMMADGVTGWWVPDARVRHYIPSTRQTIAFLRKYYKGYGEYCALRDLDTEEVKLFGAPRWLWREAIAAEIRYRWRRYFSQPDVWIVDLMSSSQARGQLRGFRENRKAAEAKQHRDEIKNEIVAK
jgi:glycosyltransferase involved in cell wall biosynthesis